MDHQYSSCIRNEEWFEKEEVIDGTGNIMDEINICVPEKIGDEYLIELYRERRFLYDKRHRDFKDNELKKTAWEEISSIMTKDKNLGT